MNPVNQVPVAIGHLGKAAKTNHCAVKHKELQSCYYWIEPMPLLKVNFGSRSHSRVPDFYSIFVKKSPLKGQLYPTLSRVNPTATITPPRRSGPYLKPQKLKRALPDVSKNPSIVNNNINSSEIVNSSLDKRMSIFHRIVVCHCLAT